MKSIVTPLVLALLLLVAGLASWTLGQAHVRIADVERQVATMEYDAVFDDGDEADGGLASPARLAALADDAGRSVMSGRATADYWLGRYDALPLERDAGGALIEKDPRLLLLSANAAFRASERRPVDRDAAIDRLDIVIRNYGDVLKSNPPADVLAEAAFNFEFATRVRATLERARPGPLAPPAKLDTTPPSIHGRAGGPPKDSDPNEFRVVVPKRSDERDQNPEGGQGQERIRKG